ncbi:MAG: tetratricopeptide repeat protein [Planctomycetes bacterium]|nr:tetratricopeptide repeat protein [Planctomycetota bacterium]
MADRYTYIPNIGLFVSVVWLVPGLVPSGFLRTKVLPAVAVAVLATCASLAWLQTAYWQDSITLLKRTLAVTDNNQPAHRHMALILTRQGKYEKAFQHYREALRIDPADRFSRNNFAALLISQGRVDEGITQFRLALRYNPTNRVVRENLGVALLETRRFAEATLVFQQALKRDPQNAEVHFSLSKSLAGEGRMEEAGHHFRKAQELKQAQSLHESAR